MLPETKLSRQRKPAAVVQPAIGWDTGLGIRSALLELEVDPSKGSGKGRAGKAYSPTYFSLCEDLEDEEAYCDMVFDDDDDANEMQQDSGLSATDLRRKTNQTGRTCEADATTSAPWVSSEESPLVPIPVKDLRVYYVMDRAAERPDGLIEDKLTLRDLQSVCDKWEIKVTGTKVELRERLIRFFAGQAVVQKGYSKLYAQMLEKELPSSLDLPVKPKAKAKFKAPPTALTKAAASTSSMATPGRGYTSGSASDRGRVVVETMMMATYGAASSLVGLEPVLRVLRSELQELHQLQGGHRNAAGLEGHPVRWLIGQQVKVI
eukprot:s1186_g4.t1